MQTQLPFCLERAQLYRLLKKSEKQIPRRLKSTRDDKNQKDLLRT